MIPTSLYLLFSGYGAVALMIAFVVAKIASASYAGGQLFCRVFPVRPDLDPRTLFRTARTILTFGIGNMLGMASQRINVIMVSLWADITTVGHYAAATKIMEIGMIVTNVFAPLLLSRMAHNFSAKGNRDPNWFGAWYEGLFALVVPTCVGVWVFAELILETLFGKAFGDALWILRILMIYVLTETADIVMSVILKAAHRQRQDALCLAFNPLTNIVLNLALIPVLGPIGAAIGRVAGGAVSATLRHLLIAQVLDSGELASFCVETGADQPDCRIGLFFIARRRASGLVAVILYGSDSLIALDFLQCLFLNHQRYHEFPIRGGLSSIYPCSKGSPLALKLLDPHIPAAGSPAPGSGSPGASSSR